MSVEQDIYNLATIKLANLYKLAAEQTAAEQADAQRMPSPEPHDLRHFGGVGAAAEGLALENEYSPYSFNNYRTPRMKGETGDEWNSRVRTPITNMYADPSIRATEYAAGLAGGAQVPRFAEASEYIVPNSLEELANPLLSQYNSPEFKRENRAFRWVLGDNLRHSPAVERVRRYPGSKSNAEKIYGAYGY